MVHRHKHMCFTCQLWLPYPAFCIDLPGCFQDLCIWSGTVGNKSGKLWYVLQIVTQSGTRIWRHLSIIWSSGSPRRFAYGLGGHEGKWTEKVSHLPAFLLKWFPSSY